MSLCVALMKRMLKIKEVRDLKQCASCRAALDESRINAAQAVEKHARRALRQTLMRAAMEHASECGSQIPIPYMTRLYVPLKSFLVIVRPEQRNAADSNSIIQNEDQDADLATCCDASLRFVNCLKHEKMSCGRLYL